jgi:hypothetical protein
VIYPGSTPVGNATLVVANVLTCNKHSPKKSTTSPNTRPCSMQVNHGVSHYDAATVCHNPPPVPALP